jgi:hypothetical protein
MDIRFVSTLTSEDEDDIAPALLKAATSLLDRLSLSYTLRIETTARTVYQHHHPPAVQSSVAEAVEDNIANRADRRVPVPQC